MNPSDFVKLSEVEQDRIWATLAPIDRFAITEHRKQIQLRARVIDSPPIFERPSMVLLLNIVSILTVVAACVALVQQFWIVAGWLMGGALTWAVWAQMLNYAASAAFHTKLSADLAVMRMRADKEGGK